MRKNKKILLCCAALTAVLVCIAVGIFFAAQPQKISYEAGKVDLTDIATMNIGAEMPKLLYADENKAILQGPFGVLVYDLTNSRVADRISYAWLQENGITQLCAAVSQDGNVIFLGNLENLGENYLYKYELHTQRMLEYDEAAIAMFMPTQISPGYDAAHDPYLDMQYLIGSYIAELDGAFLYVRAKQDWSMSSLQIVRCSYETTDEKVWEVFERRESITKF